MVAGWVVLISTFLVIGADLMWVVAMGDHIRREGMVPDGIPFATAPQQHWANPVVLAQVTSSLVAGRGDLALPAIHLILVATVLVILLVEARRMGAREARSALTLSLVVIGASSAFVVIRYPAISLLPFVVLLLLIRLADAGRSSYLVWAVPPLMILWGNLHGGVLVGLAVLGVYALLGRGVPAIRRAGAGAVSLLALVLTPAGLDTPGYYLSALSNEAAVQRVGLWAPPSLSNPLDVAMILVATLLLLLAARRLTVWEWAVALCLTAGTVSAARHGVWLILFLAPLAAVGGAREGAPGSAPGRPHTVLAVALAGVTAAAVLLQLAARECALRPPGAEVVSVIVERGGPDPVVLAKEPDAETFAAAGLTVWASNPIDAFQRGTQREFLDFLDGCRIPTGVYDVVVVDVTCSSAFEEVGWRVTHNTGRLVVLQLPG
ncbi:hypothetical protein [Fodinibacter luteus]|uniref:hypothetical protein n=1 Tax=Fodinibacter luteus TaxID=552064 RepID=UPI0031E6A9A0